MGEQTLFFLVSLVMVYTENGSCWKSYIVVGQLLVYYILKTQYGCLK
jgi:hypothetical protein